MKQKRSRRVATPEFKRRYATMRRWLLRNPALKRRAKFISTLRVEEPVDRRFNRSYDASKNRP
ncbi:MAG TPA: hypothetical protein VGJ37_16720 [Pyrinomonadaceae bacterium]